MVLKVSISNALKVYWCLSYLFNWIFMRRGIVTKSFISVSCCYLFACLLTFVLLVCCYFFFDLFLFCRPANYVQVFPQENITLKDKNSWRLTSSNFNLLVINLLLLIYIVISSFPYKIVSWDLSNFPVILLKVEMYYGLKN